MTAKFRQIIEQLNALITFKVDMSITDDDFIAGIEAYLLLCSLNSDLNIDCSGLRSRRGRIFSEFTRRISSHSEIQFAIPLIRILHHFIYDRGGDHIPVKWKDTFNEFCFAVVDSYSKNPLISVTDYLFALDTTSRMDDDCDNDDIIVYKAAINTLLEDIENVSINEKVRRVKAYDLSHYLFIADNWEKWTEIKESLKHEDYHQFDDETFLTWCDLTDQCPVEELNKRSDNSKLMKVEYLRALSISEFKKQRLLKADRMLAKDLKTLNDEIIGDFIDTNIDVDMPLSTLRALESIFYLRLQLRRLHGKIKSRYTTLYAATVIRS